MGKGLIMKDMIQTYNEINLMIVCTSSGISITMLFELNTYNEKIEKTQDHLV
jgi:hypothetical protein